MFFSTFNSVISITFNRQRRASAQGESGNENDNSFSNWFECVFLGFQNWLFTIPLLRFNICFRVFSSRFFSLSCVSNSRQLNCVHCTVCVFLPMIFIHSTLSPWLFILCRHSMFFFHFCTVCDILYFYYWLLSFVFFICLFFFFICEFNLQNRIGWHSTMVLYCIHELEFLLYAFYVSIASSVIHNICSKWKSFCTVYCIMCMTMLRILRIQNRNSGTKSVYHTKIASAEWILWRGSETNSI